MADMLSQMQVAGSIGLQTEGSLAPHHCLEATTPLSAELANTIRMGGDAIYNEPAHSILQIEVVVVGTFDSKMSSSSKP